MMIDDIAYDSIENGIAKKLQSLVVPYSATITMLGTTMHQRLLVIVYVMRQVACLLTYI